MFDISIFFTLIFILVKEEMIMDMSVWFLMGAALVFFMQCGFAMVEAGFTRSKNTGNITMKNLMDFCIAVSYTHLTLPTTSRV